MSVSYEVKQAAMARGIVHITKDGYTNDIGCDKCGKTIYWRIDRLRNGVICYWCSKLLKMVRENERGEKV